MTPPEGDKYHGWWKVESVDAPRAFEGAHATILSTFPSAEALQQQLDMGMEQGMREAMSQKDDVLAGTGS
jgi:hypothetical protein